MRDLKNFTKRNFVLVYQMGKVGSSSIYNSMSGAVNVHTLYGNPPNPPHLQLSYPWLLPRVKYFFSCLVRRFLIYSRKHTKIVTVVRCPYERNISMFFQALPFWMAEYYSGFGVASRAHNNKGEGLEVLWDCFKENFNHDYPVRWFDNEIGRLTGIKISDFVKVDANQRIWRASKKGFEVLLLDVSEVRKSTSVISNFCGQNYSPVDVNVGDKKWYAQVYRDFKERYLEEYKATFPSLGRASFVNELDV